MKQIIDRLKKLGSWILEAIKLIPEIIIVAIPLFIMICMVMTAAILIIILSPIWLVAWILFGWSIFNVIDNLFD